MRVTITTRPLGPGEEKTVLANLADALSEWNGQVLRRQRGKPPCCAWCANLELRETGDLVDAAELVRRGYGGPISLVCYSVGLERAQGVDATLGWRGGDPVVVLPTGQIRDPLHHYREEICDCPGGET